MKRIISLFLAFIILGFGGLFIGIAQTVDTDGDGIFDDGDNNGTVGDNPCVGGNTLNCDDNCLNAYNPNQVDLDGDGIGKACEDNAIDFGEPSYSGKIGELRVDSNSLSSISNKEFTIEAWVKPKPTSTPSVVSGGIFSRFDSKGAAMWVKNGEPKFGVRMQVPMGGGTSTPYFVQKDYTVNSLGSMIADTWYHIVGIFRNSANSSPVSSTCSSVPHMEVYINGELRDCAETEGNFAQDPDNVNTLSIGRLGNSIDGLDRSTKFYGVIDDVRFWTVARTAQEIQQCMNYELGFVPECQVDPAILKGYWKLDEGIGSVVSDSSGNGYTGNLEESYCYSWNCNYSPSAWSSGWIDGYSFAAVESDGDGDGYTILQGDCDDNDVSVYPGASEICDGKDNDCDIDTGDGAAESWIGNACDGADGDLCEEGVYQCTNGVQSCTDYTGTNAEICDNADNDCDGSVDEDFGVISCGEGVCVQTVDSCVNGQLQVCVPGSPSESPETTCNDNLDNDCDSYIDIVDPDCNPLLDNAIDFGEPSYSGKIGELRVDSNSLPSISNKEFTIEAWVKPKPTSTPSVVSGGIFSRFDSKGAAMWVKNGEPKFGVRMQVPMGGGTSTPYFVQKDYTVNSLGSMIADTWYHIVGIFRNSANSSPVSSTCSSVPHMEVYINGELRDCAETEGNFAQDPDNVNTLSIGRLGNSIDGLDRSTKFYGVIDDVRFWTVARTAQEIQQCMNYELGFVPECQVDPAILKGYWKLDEGIGSVVSDSSGNGYTGNLEESYCYSWNCNYSPSAWSSGWIDGYSFAAVESDGDGDGYTILQGDCDDNDVSVYPGASEICDGKDNDCDIDTGDGAAESWIGNACDGADGDLCEEGVYQCTNGVQSCTDYTGTNAEICDNADNDCDGSVDEDFGVISCGEGVCVQTVDSCVNGQLQVCVPGSPSESPETTCNDNLDNDCDSYIDIVDPDCNPLLDNAIDFGEPSYSGKIGELRVDSNSLPSISNKEFTIEAWVKPKPTSTPSVVSGGIFSRFDSKGAAMWVKNGEPKFGVRMQVPMGGGTSTPYFVQKDYTVNSLGSMIADTWYHIVGIFRNSANSSPVSSTCSSVPHMEVYINGELRDCAETEGNFAQDPDNVNTLSIGRLGNSIDGLDRSTKFYGVIDDVRFWTVARTAQEIQQCMNYELGFVPECQVDPAILKGYWKLDEGIGSVVSDSSGNGYTGNLEESYCYSWNCNYSPSAWSSGWIDGYSFAAVESDGDGDGYTILQGDCDDNDVSVYPGASEICDGKDNDCDIDTGDGAAESWIGNACDGADGDLCEEGVYQCTNGVQSCTDYTGTNAEICDNADNDCDGVVDEIIRATTCGEGQCSGNTGTETCISGSWVNDTCDPFAGATGEVCDNVDNDCNGSTDENLIQATTCGVGQCAGNTGAISCIAGTWVNDTCDPFDGATAELCDNVDNDCDSTTDENLVQATICGVGQCAGNTGTETCNAGTWVNDTCDPFDGATAELCDNVDNDCDSTTDENLVQATICGVGKCAGNTGTETCNAGNWINNTCNPFAGATAEICDNLDNDCDGTADENLVQTTTCGVGQCAGNTGAETCNAGSWVNDTCDPFAGATAEVCSDTFDNDCDGLTDSQDSECQHNGQTTFPKKINFQGYLTDSEGNPVDGILAMSLSIYDVETEGTSLWSETQNVTVNEGIFNVILGEVNPIDLTFNAAYYLGVKVGTDPEMTPRKELTSVPYAFAAKTEQPLPETPSEGTYEMNCIRSDNSTGSFGTDPFNSAHANFELEFAAELVGRFIIAMGVEVSTAANAVAHIELKDALSGTVLATSEDASTSALGWIEFTFPTNYEIDGSRLLVNFVTADNARIHNCADTIEFIPTGITAIGMGLENHMARTNITISD